MAHAHTTDFRGSPAVTLQAPDGARATVLLLGGQVVSWCPAGGSERLYLSERAVFREGTAVRGGVPIIFPQFGPKGPLPRHGFARDRMWTLLDARTGADYAMAVLRLTDSEATRALWPHEFSLEVSVCVSGNRLDVELEVLNPGEAPFSFTCGVHTYMRVAEVEQTQVEGLRGLRYIDLGSGEEKLDTGVVLNIDDEVDRLYLDAPPTLLMREAQRSLGVHSEGYPDAVIWNPWEARCATIADMPPLDFRRMLCVEAVAARPITLDTETSWWGRQTLVAM